MNNQTTDSYLIRLKINGSENELYFSKITFDRFSDVITEYVIYTVYRGITTKKNNTDPISFSPQGYLKSYESTDVVDVITNLDDDIFLESL
jgi:hypothetical protein